MGMPPLVFSPHPIPPQTMSAGQSASVGLTPFFSDADGDALAYAATVSDVGIAAVSVSGNILTIAGVSPGTAVLTVFASDPGGLSATQRTQVTVAAPNRASGPVGTIPRQTLAPGQWVLHQRVLLFSRSGRGDTELFGNDYRRGRSRCRGFGRHRHHHTNRHGYGDRKRHST